MGFDPKEPMGQAIVDFCDALKAVVLGDSGGVCMTISTVHQDNIIIVAARDLRLAGNDGFAMRDMVKVGM